MKKELSKFSADITVFENEIIIKKSDLTHPTENLCGNNDHRIAMSAAAAAFSTSGTVTVKVAEAVKKSYPSFWDEIR